MAQSQHHPVNITETAEGQAMPSFNVEPCLKVLTSLKKEYNNPLEDFTNNTKDEEFKEYINSSVDYNNPKKEYNNTENDDNHHCQEEYHKNNNEVEYSSQSVAQKCVDIPKLEENIKHSPINTIEKISQNDNKYTESFTSNEIDKSSSSCDKGSIPSSNFEKGTLTSLNNTVKTATSVSSENNESLHETTNLSAEKKETKTLCILCHSMVNIGRESWRDIYTDFTSTSFTQVWHVIVQVCCIILLFI